MHVVRSEEMGFCIGVKRALSLLEGVKKEKSGRPLYVYGDIAHNAHVMEWVKSNGFETIYDPLDASIGSTVVIRAHGISDSDRSLFLSRSVELIDATCPLVLKNQNAMRASEYPVILFGIKGHSETVAVEGASRGKYYLVETPADLDAVPVGPKYRIIVQTTFESGKYKALISELDSRGYSYIVSNTICMASERRRAGIRSFLGSVDLVFVVGDRKSANSNALVSEARSIGLDAYLVEDESHIDFSLLKGKSSVGISAGSSTPDDVIENVIRRIESYEYSNSDD